MKKLLFAVAVGAALFVPSLCFAQTPVVPCVAQSSGSTGSNCLMVSSSNPLPVASGAYAASQTPVTASATGTTAATTATLPAATGKTTYLCGFSIRANATAAATGNATVTGTISGTLNFTQWTAPLASGIGITEPSVGHLCIPASGSNQAIAVISAAPGAGGTVSVSAWGFQQ